MGVIGGAFHNGSGLLLAYVLKSSMGIGQGNVRSALNLEEVHRFRGRNKGRDRESRIPVRQAALTI